MPSDNTISDIKFAGAYVKFVSERSFNPEHRARAKTLMAMLDYLDATGVDWRKDLLEHLERNGITRAVPDMFSLPKLGGAKFYDTFMKEVIGVKAQRKTKD